MLKVYNTLTGKKEEFKPFTDKVVRMYVCGLTVQNYSHVGHIRSAINYDVIRRYLEYKGYNVIYIQNFTDINEKIVARAREEGLTPPALAEKYRKAYLEDIDKLNVKKADIYCSATENIKEIIEMVQTLIDKGFAYVVNGNVYFNVEKYADYGKLSGRNLAEMKAGSRIEVNQEKRHPMDFALWKKVEEEERTWESPWGPGWPGWHIECSAMSIKYLNEKIDIHGGGTDLIFPHHENEIAQSEACTGAKPFVKYWLHNGTVNIKGEKMSKSVGNFYTTRELLAKFTPDQIRYFLLTKHYHSPIDFSLDEIKNTQSSLQRIKNVMQTLSKLIDVDAPEERSTDVAINLDDLENSINYYRKAFLEAMDNDFNTARAIGVLHELISNINSQVNNSEFKVTVNNKLILKEALKLLEDITDVLGLTLSIEKDTSVNTELVNGLVDYILEIRKEARARKDWEQADKIRDDLEEMGIVVKDTPHGVDWEMESD